MASGVHFLWVMAFTTSTYSLLIPTADATTDATCDATLTKSAPGLSQIVAVAEGVLVDAKGIETGPNALTAEEIEIENE